MNHDSLSKSRLEIQPIFSPYLHPRERCWRLYFHMFCVFVRMIGLCLGEKYEWIWTTLHESNAIWSWGRNYLFYMKTRISGSLGATCVETAVRKSRWGREWRQENFWNSENSNQKQKYQEGDEDDPWHLEVGYLRSAWRVTVPEGTDGLLKG